MLNTAVARRKITPLESDGQAPFAWVVLDLCVIGIGALSPEAVRERIEAGKSEFDEAQSRATSPTAR